MFVDPFRARGNQAAVLIVAEHQDPIEDGIGPFSIRQEALGLCAERLEERGNVAVMPGDENALSLSVARRAVARAGD